jgi:hypothetical protein
VVEFLRIHRSTSRFSQTTRVSAAPISMSCNVSCTPKPTFPVSWLISSKKRLIRRFSWTNLTFERVSLASSIAWLNPLSPPEQNATPHADSIMQSLCQGHAHDSGPGGWEGWSAAPLVRVKCADERCERGECFTCRRVRGLKTTWSLTTQQHRAIESTAVLLSLTSRLKTKASRQGPGSATLLSAIALLLAIATSKT